MGIFSWILLGLLAGILKKVIMPGDDKCGFVMTTLLGVAGAFIGGWLASLVGLGTVGEFSLASLLTAIVGALVLLLVLAL